MDAQDGTEQAHSPSTDDTTKAGGVPPTVEDTDTEYTVMHVMERDFVNEDPYALQTLRGLPVDLVQQGHHWGHERPR